MASSEVGACPFYAQVEEFSKSSPDLNHVEGVWHRLRQELEKKAPTGIETRAAFLARLRRTVARMNQSGEFKTLATNQKQRAREVIALKGAKCKW